MHMRIAIAAAIGSIVTFSLMEMGPERVGGAPAMQGRKPPSGEIATFTKLPSLESNAEAHGVNEAVRLWSVTVSIVAASGTR